MKTRRFALCLATVFLVAIYINIQRSHTFTLSNDEGTIKTEQIQPLWGTVKVSGDCDTEVVFTDVETGEKYRIGYITQGVTERIKLERGKWYKVAGGGNLTLNPVNTESGKHSSRINVSSLRAAMKAEAEKRVLNIHIGRSTVL